MRNKTKRSFPSIINFEGQIIQVKLHSLIIMHFLQGSQWNFMPNCQNPALYTSFDHNYQWRESHFINVDAFFFILNYTTILLNTQHFFYLFILYLPILPIFQSHQNSWQEYHETTILSSISKISQRFTKQNTKKI